MIIINFFKIHTQTQNQATQKSEDKKEEDYNEEIDESIGSKKKEQVTQIANLETKHNNLNEISDQNSSKTRFYTTPDDFYGYRSMYPYANFSFTPQSGTGYPYENYGMGFPMFPTIPNHYKLVTQNLQGERLDSDDGNTIKFESKEKEE
jgi:hypothetical protein